MRRDGAAAGIVCVVDAERAVRRMVECFNAMDADGGSGLPLDDIYDPALVWHESATSLSPGGRSGGIDALRAALEFERVLCQNRRIDVCDVVTAGDRIAVRYRWSGTIAAELGAGMPRIGDRVYVDNALFMRIEGGRVVEVSRVLAEPVIEAGASTNP